MIIGLVPWEATHLRYRELGNYFSNHLPAPSQVAFVIFPTRSNHLPDGELAF